MSKELVVAKFGSNIVVSDEFDTHERLRDYTKTLLAERDPQDLIIVSSGAVALGKREIALMDRDPGLYTLQQKAQIGGAAISEAWRGAFRDQGVLAGGLLVTHHELADKQEGGTLVRLLKRNRERGIVSIINENDALSVSELMQLATGGDNDGLASHVGRLVGADGLILYTKSGGVFDNDKRPIPRVSQENEQAVTAMLEFRGVETDSPGRGGMLSKHTHASDFSQTTGWAMIAPPPTDLLDTDNATYYPKAA